jgi:hypothetical protein
MRTNTKGLAVLASFAALSAVASAGLGDYPFRIVASSSLGTAMYQVGISDFQYNPVAGTWTWNLSGPVELSTGSGTLIGTLSEGNAHYVADPVINLGFVVAAGGAATHFTISSALLSFPTITPAHGIASASTTLTDGNGDGGTLTGLLGGKSYRAHYNGFLAAGTTFTSLTGGLAVGAHGSTSTTESFGFAPMGSVSDMSSQWDFTVSALDLASGTSHYNVELVPEPASMAGFALGLGFLAARRRRKA